MLDATIDAILKQTAASPAPKLWQVSAPQARAMFLAMRDAFRKMRQFLMTTQGLTEDEAISLMSVGVDFGVTQVVDGNWGVHAILRKNLFAAVPA